MEYFSKEPFDHWVIDDFLPLSQALQLAHDFCDFDSKDWYNYDNPLEVKKTLNNWWCFPPTTYKFIEYLNSVPFIKKLEFTTRIKNLHPDPGLHGAGWHIHGRGGKLNVHLDYSIHPKLGLERKLNLIYYLSDWNPKWGGNLEFWSHDPDTGKAKEKVTTIDCKFNRAVIFDTTQNSWHGFADPLTCPKDQYRKSIAMYYLVEPTATADEGRKRAYYSPSKTQENDPEVLSLIESRVR